MTWTRTGHEKSRVHNAGLNLAMKPYKFKNHERDENALADILLVGTHGSSEIKIKKYEQAGKIIISQLEATEYFTSEYPEYFL